jgi:hypothetical protein
MVTLVARNTDKLVWRLRCDQAQSTFDGSLESGGGFRVIEDVFIFNFLYKDSL